MSKTPGGSPTSWTWKDVVQGVDTIPDGGPTDWDWELLNGLTIAPVGTPTGWEWGEIGLPFEYTQMRAVMSLPDDGTWIEKDLYTLYGVPKGAVAQIVMFNLQPVLENYPGVRTYGSAITGGATWALNIAKEGYAMQSVFVQTDEDGKIEIYNPYQTFVQFALIGYLTGCTFTMVEKENMTVGTLDTWEDEDVYTLYDIPKNSVLSVAILNYDGDINYLGGVRENGSALERRYRISHRDYVYGNMPIGCVLVQVDSNGIIELYKEHSDVRLMIQGYFSPNVQFTEAHADTVGAVSGSWADKDLDAFGAPNNAIAAMVVINASSTTGLYGGVRKDGTILQRREDIREVYAGGYTGYMALVVTAATNARIEMYEQNNLWVGIFYTGYLSTV